MQKKTKNSSPKGTSQKGTKEKKEKKNVPHAPVKLEVKLVSYTMKAVIPTMMYGNIAPEITVEARTIEEASRACLAHIEDLYRNYAEDGRDGRPAKFLQKASVVETVRSTEPKKVESNPPSTPPQTVVSPDPSPKKEEPIETPLAEKSAPFLKAEKAVAGAMSLDALGLIEDQIQKSTKLSVEEKPLLLEAVLKKRKELN